MSVMQLDLSRQKLYMSPNDPLPEFHPPPRAILVTPIYDTPLSGDNSELQNFSQPRNAPVIVHTNPNHIDPDPERYQASSSRRHDDRPYTYSPARDQQYDSDPPYYPEHSRDRYSRSYPQDHSRRRRSLDYYDSSDDGRPRHGYYSSDYDRSSDDYNHTSEYDRSSDHDRYSSKYDPRDHNQSSSRPRSLTRHKQSPSRPRSLTQYKQSPSQPRSLTQQKLQKPNHPLKRLESYLEKNRQAANRDPLAHLKACSEDIQRIIKALPPSPHFCWSQCTGQRKAVCIGINYTGQENALKGCANDARHMRSFLINNYKFESNDILLLADDGKPASMKPTRKNMFDAMSWLVKDAKINDSLFFHYSGHGGQVKDETGREADGMDEVIFPSDFKSASHIVDDDLFKALVAPLPTGCRLTAVFDSCHSGTILDLPYLHSAHGRLRSLSHISKRAQQRGVAPSADVICFAACKDDETSADTFQGGVAVGAMSYALLKILKGNTDENTHQTYGEILQQLRDILIPKYHQKAQISGTHPTDLDRDFTI